MSGSTIHELSIHRTLTAVTNPLPLTVGALVMVTAYNSYFNGLMGTVVEIRENTGPRTFSDDSAYIVAIANGEERIYAYVNRFGINTPQDTYSFPEFSLTALPAGTDITVKRINPPTC